MRYQMPGTANDDSFAQRIINQFAAEKKKTIIAMSLIAVMLFMWVKVFAGKKPKTAAAKSVNQTMTDSQNPSGSPDLTSAKKVELIELPEVRGRHDVLTRDFFTVRDWESFVRGAGYQTGQAGILSTGTDREIAQRILRVTRLEAIELGQNPRAFINNKLLSVGDAFTVRDLTGEYICRVVRIEENEVLVNCQEVQIQLRLTELLENNR